jgi:uncharacterized protein
LTALSEYPVVFDCLGSQLMGIVHDSVRQSDVVFVIVVGGPQYRVGSHRMFVELARALAAEGFPSLRFDCRGMGDSDGTFTSFENLTDDIRTAIDCALKATATRRVVLIGLCDGASASAMYGFQDARVSGMVLMNPWVRTEAGEAKARVRHYYGARVLQREFWRQLIGGEVKVVESVVSFVRNLRSASRPLDAATTWVDQMLVALSTFKGRVLCVLSEQDLVAQEFSLLVQSSSAWNRLILGSNVRRDSLEGADHTFSGEGQMRRIVCAIVEWTESELSRPIE